MVQEAEYYDLLYKIVLVGDSGVGKTCILSRYTKNSVSMTSVPTIGVEFATKIVTLPSGTTIKAQIWDTAGQERYLAITRAHYQRAVGALLVYDITNVDSFKNVIRWIHEIKENGGPDIVIMLVGNKVDCENERKVTREQGESFAKEHGLLFEETSAHAAIRVRDSFENLLKEINVQKAKF